MNKKIVIYWLSPCITLGFAIWFWHIPQQPPLEISDNQLKEVLSDIANATALGAKDLDLERFSAKTKAKAIFLSYYSATSGVQSAFKIQADLSDVAELYQKLQKNTSDVMPTTIKLDIINPLSRQQSTQVTKKNSDLGLYALEVGTGEGIHILSDQIMAWMIYSSEKGFHAKRALERFKQLYGVTPKQEAVFRSKNPNLHWHQQISYIYQNGQASATYRGRKKHPENLTSKDIIEGIDIAEHYIMNSVRDNGQFNYLYYPHSDKIHEKKYNILRHAGTIYSMLSLYQWRKNPKLWDKINETLAFLRSTFQPCPPEHQSQLCVIEQGYTKIGGACLTLLAISLYLDIAPSEELMIEGKALANRIMSLQGAEGQFLRHKESYPEGIDSKFISGYYPGEAIYGLSAFYRHTKDKRMLDSAEKGALWIAKIRDREKSIENLAHDHWLLYGINEISKHRKNLDLENHTLKLLRTIMNDQVDTSPYLDWVGGFRKFPTSASTATSSEGMLAGLEHINRAKLDFDKDKLINTIERALKVQLATQLNEEKAMFTLKPNQSLGGFGKTSFEYKIRIDNVQHNLSAFLMSLEILP